MAKQLNVSLAFSADTSQAKAQIQNLQNSLNNLLKSTNVGSSLGLNAEINSAITNVAKLKAQLDSATNVKTGQLDLGKFNESLKKSGTTLSQYAKSLQNLGPEGDKAFSQLAQAITTAEVPLRRANGLLAEFGTTLKNTARWQISSSVLHGLQGAMQGAWSYAKDLNESLNDIRIVTGQSTDQMAKFAEQANKAAKNLGTTTTKYTDAALIYYQQGLSDKEVQERTNTTIKMANVTGENATDVSSYMTAVWNNFNKAGDQAAEHYGDIMTKLGAETAASTDEIAAGLSKFSAVADTIGLSFEMASSAVTAIIDQTRESPEVVGTALKTIFSRIEGLKQGETLEDGVDLNKYSEGLAKVGVSIMDASGQLKDMDTILYDVGATWTDLNKEQKVALAQTVAGTRQYNQFIALFDNWDKVQENLLRANSAEGSLQEQADIYAESWEAASNRVKTAWQGIYDSLIDDEFIIDLTNGFADFLSIIERLIDSMGGFKGVMLVVGSIMMKTFSADMTRSLENMAYNIRSMSAGGKKEILDLRQDANKSLKRMYADSNDPSGPLKADVYTRQAKIQDSLILKEQEMLRLGKNLTEEEKKRASILMDSVNSIGQQTIKINEQRVALEKNNATLKTQIEMSLSAANGGYYDDSDFNINQMMSNLNSVENFSKMASFGENILAKFSQTYQEATNPTNIKILTSEMQKFIQEADASGISLHGLDSILEDIANATNRQQLTDGFERLKSAIISSKGAAQSLISQIREMASQRLNTEQYNDLNNKLKQFESNLEKGVALTREEVEELIKLKSVAGVATDEINKMAGKVYTAADGITALAGMMMNVTMAIQGIKNLGSIWENEDLSTGEKILQTMTSMSMILPALVSLMNKENYAKLAGIPISLAKAAGYETEGKAALTAGTATKYLWSSLVPLLPVLLPIIIAMGAFAVAAWKIWNETHKARKELENQTETLKDLKDQYTDVANSIQDVNSQLTDLESKSDALKNLEYGTAKWREQLMEVNNSASDLIEKYGLLEGTDWFVDSSGKINIKDEAKEKIQDQNVRALRAAQAAKDTQEYVVSNAEKEALIEEIQYDQSYRGFTGKERKTHAGGKNRSPKVIKETSGLEESQIRDVLTILDNALDNEKTFDLSNKDSLIDLGIDEEIANIIASNEKLQGSIERLTVSTDEASSAYAQTFISDFASNQNLKDEFVKAEVDEGMYGAIYSEMAEDSSRLVEEKVNAILENTDTHDSILEEYTKLVGIEEKDGKYYRADDTEYENAIEGGKEAVLKEAANWKAVEDAISDTTTEVEDYIKAAKNSENNWKAAEKIQKPFKTYLSLLEKEKTLLKDGKKLSAEDEKAKTIAIENVKAELGGLLDLNETALQNLLDPKFVEKNANLIEQAIEGDASALQELKLKAAEDIIIGLNFEEGKEEQLLNELAIIESILPDLEVGASLDESGIKQQLMNIVLACATTAEEAQEMFNMLGFPEVEFVEVGAPVGGTSRTNFYEVPDPNNPGETIRITTQDLVSFGGEKFYYPVTKKSKYTPDLSKFSLGNSGDSGGGGGTGSGGSKTTVKKIDVVDSSEEVERYKEVNDQLDNQSKLLERLNTKSEHLYGKDKINNLTKINNALKQENKLLDDKIKLAKNYQKQDKTDLNSDLSAAAKEAGLDLSFTYDKETKDITNYTEVMTSLYDELARKQTNYNNKYAEKEETEESKTAAEDIDTLENLIETVKESADRYDESVNDEEELLQEKLENLNEILSNNFEKIEEGIELKVSLEELEDTEIDYKMSLIEDDFYKRAEYGALSQQQGQQSVDKLNISAEGIKELDDAYKLYLDTNGEDGISKADYIAGLTDRYNEIYSDLSDINAKDKEMREYYGNALSDGLAELEKYTDQMDHFISVLSHYESILELTGQEKDYEKIGAVLESQAEVLLNNREIASAEYEMHQQLQADLEADLAAISDTKSESYKIAKASLDAQVEATNEAHEKMLASQEEYLKVLNAIWENETKKLAETLEKSLTDGMGFDRLKESMQNTSEIADEYLTKTNQLYETNKLLSDIQGDIDKTNNVAVKQRLNNFAQEIEQLQKKGKLSNLELEIAQAKYKQLQAQIALEEAQNEKSVVRLSRDNEGNYGYVYTADQDAISEAEQAVADADNDLYNLQLDAANKYGEKAIQAREELYQALTEIDNTYAENSDEWFAAREEALSEYYAKCDMYTELYGIAQQGDARVVEDAWVNSYKHIIDDGGKWKTAVNGYVEEVKTKYDEWKNKVDTEVEPTIGTDLDTLKGKTEAVKDESEKLRDQVVNKTIPDIKKTLTDVNNQATAYGEWRDNIADVIEQMQLLAKEQKKKVTDLTNEEESPAQEPEKDEPKKEDPKEDPKEPASKQGNGVLNKGDKVIFESGKYYHTSEGAEPSGYYHRGEEVVADRYVPGANKPWHISTLSGGALGWLTKKQLSGYDTGGYTGEWGPEGKLAMLHEKEIVLNKEDSANILKVVEIVRTMIDANVAQAGLGILQASSIADNRQTLEQTVTITAEFPNATDHNEIELAFDSLINRATQYANRK